MNLRLTNEDENFGVRWLATAMECGGLPPFWNQAKSGFGKVKQDKAKANFRTPYTIFRRNGHAHRDWAQRGMKIGKEYTSNPSQEGNTTP